MLDGCFLWLDGPPHQAPAGLDIHPGAKLTLLQLLKCPHLFQSRLRQPQNARDDEISASLAIESYKSHT